MRLQMRSNAAALDTGAVPGGRPLGIAVAMPAPDTGSRRQVGHFEPVVTRPQTRQGFNGMAFPQPVREDGGVAGGTSERRERACRAFERGARAHDRAARTEHRVAVFYARRADSAAADWHAAASERHTRLAEDDRQRARDALGGKLPSHPSE
jgi:hypothetical protein